MVGGGGRERTFFPESLMVMPSDRVFAVKFFVQRFSTLLVANNKIDVHTCVVRELEVAKTGVLTSVGYVRLR